MGWICARETSKAIYRGGDVMLSRNDAVGMTVKSAGKEEQT